MPHICPSWLGPLLLLNPLRRLLENPERMFRGLIEGGMTVLEPGCGMGYFTLPIARMVGPRGKVVAVDIQPKMLSGLARRVEKAGLKDRIVIRLATQKGMGLVDINSVADLAIALYMVHEVMDQTSFFREIRDVLKPDGKLFILEPLFHVSRRGMEKSISIAKGVGLNILLQRTGLGGRSVLLNKT